jgi:hypothetical protein
MRYLAVFGLIYDVVPAQVPLILDPIKSSLLICSRTYSFNLSPIMPVPSFLASIADKAQSAINASPLAGHLPSSGRASSPDSSAQQPANEAAAQGGQRSHTFGAIHNQLRAFGQQYA